MTKMQTTLQLCISKKLLHLQSAMTSKAALRLNGRPKNKQQIHSQQDKKNMFQESAVMQFLVSIILTCFNNNNKVAHHPNLEL